MVRCPTALLVTGSAFTPLSVNYCRMTGTMRDGLPPRSPTPNLERDMARRFPPLGRSIIVACEIDPPLDRHEADNGLVPRRERLDSFSAVIVRFAEGVWFTLGRERPAGLGKCNPAPLARW